MTAPRLSWVQGIKARQMARRDKWRPHIEAMLATNLAALAETEKLIQLGADTPAIQAEAANLRHNIGVLSKALGTVQA